MNWLLWEWRDRVGDWWTGLGTGRQAIVTSVPAWGLVAVVALAPLGPLLPDTSSPSVLELPQTPFEPALLSAPSTTSNLRFDGGNMVLSARGEDGTWVQVLEAPPERLPGQFAKMTATSPDRRRVVYVSADDPLLTNAVLHLADTATGRVRELATIPSGLFPATPVWSPDASRVAVLRRAPAGDGLELWTVQVATGEQVRVPTRDSISPEALYGADETPLSWSSDGARLAYEVPNQGEGTLVREEVAVADGRIVRREVGRLPPKPPCEVPVFSQNDPRWSAQRMRDQGDTIGAAGCALTAAAMVLNYYGADLDPDRLNACLGSAAQPLFWGAAGSRCAGDHADLENFVAFSWDTLAGLMAHGRPVILGFAGGQTGSHYVVVTSGFGRDGANYAILDPWDGTTWKTIDYYALKGYSPERLVVFRGDDTRCRSRAERPANVAVEPLLAIAPTGVQETLKWRPLIERVAREEGADPDVVQAVMALKSGGNPLAIGPSTPEGNGMGLMQVMSGIEWPWDPVAARLGRRPTRDDMLDPEHNIRAGAFALATQHNQGGNWSDWLICAVGYFGAATEDGRITSAANAGGIDGWTHYDRIRANVTWIRTYYRRGGVIPPPPNEVRRPPGWPGVGTLEMIVGGAYTISQGFGYTGFTPSAGAYDYARTLGLNAGDHAAVDISLLRGAPLYAAMDAVVITAGGTPYFRDDLNPAAGELKFRLADGAEVIYGHTAQINVAVGQTVSPGQLVALTGQAGTGSHLHLEVRVPDPTTESGMRAVDPQIFFSGEGVPGGFRANWPTAEAIDARIAMSEQQNGRGSPLHGTGSQFLELGAKYGVNPGFVVAMLQKESQLAADGSVLPTTAYNFGGITGRGNCGQHWIDFDRWADRYFAKFCSPRDGLDANFEIFTQPQYRATNGTIAAILEVYSPSFENDNRAGMATIQAVGSQLGIDLSPSTNIYGGAPGPIPPSGQPPPLPPPPPPPTQPPTATSTVTPIPTTPVVTSTADVTRTPDPCPPGSGGTPGAAGTPGPAGCPQPERPPVTPPDVRIVGIEDLASYAHPVSVERIELIFPADPFAVVEPSVPVGTVFSQEGRYSIDLTVLSPHLPGGVATITIDFVLDFTPPTTRVEVLGVPIDPPPTEPGAPTEAAPDAPPPGDQGDVPVIGEELADPIAPAAITYRNEAIVDLAAEDALSPIRAILYRIDDESWLYYTTSGPPRPISVRLPGCHTVTYLAIDAAGNKERPNAVDVCVALAETDTVVTETATVDLTATAAVQPTTTPQANGTPTQPVSTQTPPTNGTPDGGTVPGSPTATVTAVIIDPEAATLTTASRDETPGPTPPTETPVVPEPTSTVPATPTATAVVPSATAAVATTAVVVEASATPDDGSPVPSATAPLEPTVTAEAPATATLPDAASPSATLTATVETATATVEPTATATATAAPATPTSTPTLPTDDLAVLFEDERKLAIPGACFEVTAIDGSRRSACDEDDGDSDGTTLVEDIPAGSATVAMSRVPPAFATADSRQVTIGQEASVRIVGRRDAGSIRITTLDQERELVGGACFQVIEADGRDRGQLCDGQPDDGEPAEGVILIDGVAAGEAILRQTGFADGYAPAEDQRVTVPSNDEEAVEITNVRRVGSLHILVVDQANRPLRGACFALLGANGQTTAAVCDNDEQDRQPVLGSILIENLPVGPITVHQTQAPDGLSDAPDQNTIVEEGERKDVKVTHEVRFELIIRRIDDSETLLPDSCFDVYTVVNGTEDAFVGPICDDADGALDGVATMPNLNEGDYLVMETRPPATFPLADPVPVSIGPGLDNVAEVIGSRTVGTLTIRRTDIDRQTLLPGSCFDLYTAAAGAADTHVDTHCDGDDGVTDGRTTFADLTIGDYVIVEWLPPAGGYQPAATTIAGVVAGPGEEFILASGRPTETLTIIRTDETGAQRPGSCFDVYTSAGGEVVDFVTDPCDEDDGVGDGRTDARDLLPGEYVVVETKGPPGFAPGEIRVVNVEAGRANQMVLNSAPLAPTEAPTPVPVPTPEAALGETPSPTETAEIEPTAAETPTDEPVATTEPTVAPGEPSVDGDVPPVSLTIRQVDAAGMPLSGSCFTIHAVEGTAKVPITGACDDHDGAADGVTVFDRFRVGDYEIVELSPPTGYTEPLSVISLHWTGDPSEVTIVDRQVVAPLTIWRRDPAGLPVPGACFDVLSATADGAVGSLVLQGVCDEADGSLDGAALVTLVVGDYFVVGTLPTQSEPVPASMVAGERNEVLVVGDIPVTTEPTADLGTDIATDTPVPPPPTDTPVPQPVDTPVPPMDTPTPETVGFGRPALG